MDAYYKWLFPAFCSLFLHFYRFQNLAPFLFIFTLYFCFTSVCRFCFSVFWSDLLTFLSLDLLVCELISLLSPELTLSYNMTLNFVYSTYISNPGERMFLNIFFTKIKILWSEFLQTHFNLLHNIYNICIYRVYTILYIFIKTNYLLFSTQIYQSSQKNITDILDNQSTTLQSYVISKQVYYTGRCVMLCLQTCFALCLFHFAFLL